MEANDVSNYKSSIRFLQDLNKQHPRET